MDLDDLLRAFGGRDAPCLVEPARSTGPRARTVYAWSTGRLLAVVDAGGVRLRRSGAAAGSLALGWAELRTLDVVCRDWARRRDGWHAFFEASGGFPPGLGSGWFYRAPGRRSRAVLLARTVLGRTAGTPPPGADEIVPLAAPVVLQRRPRVAVVAEVRRTGDPVAERNGVEVGAVYRCAGGLEMHADRHGLRVVRAEGEELRLADGEEGAIAAVLAVRQVARRRVKSVQRCL